MFGLGKFFPSSFFPSQDPCTSNHYLQISGSNFTGIFTARPIVTKETKWSPKLSWAAVSYGKKKKSEISLATLLLLGEMEAHFQSVDLSYKSLSCRFVWPTKLPYCVVNHGQMHEQNQDESIRTGVQDIFRQIFGVAFKFEKSTNIHWLDLPFCNIRMTKATDIFCSPLFSPLNIPKHSHFSTK